MRVLHCWQETERRSAIFERVCLTNLDDGEVRIFAEAFSEWKRNIKGEALAMSFYSAYNHCSLQPYNAHVIL